LFGGGVAYIRDGRVWGGDSLYYYLGEYTLTSTGFRMALRIQPFILGSINVFGTGQAITLNLEGSFTSANQATAQGHSSDSPALRFGAKLTRRA